MREVLSFYGRCLKRAFSGWFSQLSGWAGTISLVIGLGLFFWKPPAQWREIASAFPSLFFVGLFLCFALYRLVLSPYWLFREQRDAKEEIERARRPAIEVTMPDPPGDTAMQGGTVETYGGQRQTTITQYRSQVVSLRCRNTGETTAKNCRARVMRVHRITEDGEDDFNVIESVALPWDSANTEGSHTVDIAPSETRRVWIAWVRTHGHVWVFRDIDALPVEYQQMFGPPGTYRILVQVDADNVAPQQLLLEVIGEEGPKPEKSGVWYGKATISIIAQGAPRLDG